VSNVKIPSTVFVQEHDERYEAVGALSAPMETIFVKNVTEGSPAHLAGLQCGDRLVKVNDVLVTKKTYAEVVQLIKNTPERLQLLAVPKEDDILQRVRIWPRGTVTNELSLDYIRDILL
jgi:C-terminal processing protease CtpA/Prc